MCEQQATNLSILGLTYSESLFFIFSICHVFASSPANKEAPQAMQKKEKKYAYGYKK
jgi:hypothetical protein